jgi:hypothetical protein
LKPTEADVLAFANEHGALGRDEQIIVDDGTGSRGEQLSIWREEITYMRHAVHVWEALKNKRSDDLQRWFTIESGVHGLTGLTEVRYCPEEPWPRGVLRSAGVQFLEGDVGNTVRFLGAYQSRGAPTVRSSAPSDVTDAALAWLRTVIDERLQQSTAARLLDVDKARGIPLGIRLVPHGLRGALWLQLARAIEGDRIQRRCPGCQEWFQISIESGGKRVDARYCSDTCRMRAYRGRKATQKPRTGRSRRGLKLRAARHRN